MLFPAEQAFVGRDEKRAPLKMPAWEANSPFDRRVSQQVNIKDFTAEIAVSYYNTVVYTFFARS